MKATSRLWNVAAMLKHDAADFYATSLLLTNFRLFTMEAKEREKSGKSEINLDAVKQHWVRELTKLAHSIEILGAKVTGLAVDSLLTKFSEDRIDVDDLINCADHIERTLKFELQTRKLFVLSDDESGYYEQKSPLFGAEAAAKFPSISYDVDEAGKCLALNRSTASAFHTIRCLEAGIRALTRCLGMPDQTKGSDRNWSNILRKITEELDKRWPKATRISGDGQKFEEIVAVLAALQNPYRNATMHLDRKYTEDEAKHLLVVIGGLMRAIASRMDENGDPLA